MEFERNNGPDNLETITSRGEIYRTCSVCGGDCEPEPSAEDGIGVRIIFVCPVHGVQTIVDPFSKLR